MHAHDDGLGDKRLAEGGKRGKGEKREKRGKKGRKRGKKKALMLTNPDINPSIYRYLYCYFAILDSIII